MQGIMHAFLITGKTKEDRMNEISRRIGAWKVSSWDTVWAGDEGTSIGIAAIRNFIRELQLAPRTSSAKVGVIADIHRLTVEAQNALLKTIEEPPSATYILAETESADTLLPTIQSRCETIALGETGNRVSTIPADFLPALLRASAGKRMQMVEPYIAARDDAKLFVTAILIAAQKALLTNPTHGLTKLIRNLFTAQAQLSVNVNPRLVVDNAILRASDSESV